MTRGRHCLPTLLMLTALGGGLGGCVTNSNTSASMAVAPSGRPAAPTVRTLVLIPRTTPVFVVASGKRTRLNTMHSLNADCSLNDYMTVDVVVAPAHGTATTGRGRFYPTYSKNSPYAACNTQAADGMATWYESAPGYVGPDFLEIEIIAPSGRSERVDYHFDVK